MDLAVKAALLELPLGLGPFLDVRALWDGDFAEVLLAEVVEAVGIDRDHHHRQEQRGADARGHPQPRLGPHPVVPSQKVGGGSRAREV